MSEFRDAPPSVVLELLRYAAGRQPSESAFYRPATGSRHRNDQHLVRTIEAGLFPLMYHAMGGRLEEVPATWHDALRSADVTAQVRFENLSEAAAEIVDSCLSVGVRPTLLKGISISHQHYPVPHLRPMGDIDILVPEYEFERVESTLIQSGLIRPPGKARAAGSHHGIPLYHPRRHVWLEVHVALFPESSNLSRNPLFTSAQIAAHSVDSTLMGRPVYRLTNEMQLVYIASSWIRDLSCNSLHASLILPLLDAIYLLRGSEQTFNWDRLTVTPDDELAAASLCLMLSYLSRRILVQGVPPALSRIASRQRIIGAWERKLFELLLDTYLVGGRPYTRFFNDWTALIVLNTLLERGSCLRKLFALPWNIFFPPSLPNRYSIEFHVRRIAKIFHTGEPKQDR